MKLPKINLRIAWVVSALLLLTPSSAMAAPAYVAFGDSLTTGSSIATCQDNRQTSPWGCTELPAAIPYPDRIAKILHMTYSDKAKDYQKGLAFDLYRAGIWGYSLKEAAQAQVAGHNSQGSWLPQLQAIKQATQLVTGSLGINDMHFNDVTRWAKLYIKPGGDHVTPAAQDIVRAMSPDLDQLFGSLRAANDNGAAVILGLYYNPYQTDNPACNDLSTIAGRIVDTLDNELENRAHHSGARVADFRPRFVGHGAGSDQPYVFGTQCSLSGALSVWLPAWLVGHDAKKALSIAFDPHPNNDGTNVMANLIMQELNGAD